MNVLFVDSVCPKSYDFETLESEALGGSEATLLRVARSLARTPGVYVTVEQHNRLHSYAPDNVFFTSPIQRNDGTFQSPQHGMATTPLVIVFNRTLTRLEALEADYPHATKYLWLHDWAKIDPEQLRKHNITLICVSETQATVYRKVYDKVKVIYNPINDDLQPDATPVDNNKLVFFSSPHKGLKETLAVFELIRQQFPEFRLYISNPGYMPDMSTDDRDGVINLGVLPHEMALRHVRSALCVFYPNMVFPETFGLVFAEANAVGTPVVTCPIGSAQEVLFHPQEITTSIDELIQRVLDWQTHRIKVKANPAFRLSAVTKKWLALLR